MPARRVQIVLFNTYVVGSTRAHSKHSMRRQANYLDTSVEVRLHALRTFPTKFASIIHLYPRIFLYEANLPDKARIRSLI